MSTSDAYYIGIVELRAHATRLLCDVGAPVQAAELVANVLVDADVRGHRSHGISLLPTYLHRIEHGGIDLNAVPEVVFERGPLALVDAHGGLGQIAARTAAKLCAELASKHGLGAVAVRGNNHIGMLAAYRSVFSERNVIGLILNTSGPSVAPPLAAHATLGNNAISLVVPLAGRQPFVIDFATGIVASGKIRQAALKDDSVPESWLQDRHGVPTSNPHELDRGGSVPVFGAHKGLCISLIADILVATLAAGPTSHRVHKQRHELERAMECGQLFVGFGLDAHCPRDPASVVQELEDAVRVAYDAEPERPWFPDQLEADASAAAAERGIELPLGLARELGVLTGTN